MTRTRESDTPPSPLPAVPVELDEIGLGPDSILMREPKLFQDRSFLGLLLEELHEQLGPEASPRALFQIGAWHGMRDARRIWQAPAAFDTQAQHETAGRSPSLGMRLLPDPSTEDRQRLRGAWPEHHEARARLKQGLKATGPACFLSAGYTSGWLSETHGHDFVVIEESCLASGDSACSFRAVPDRALTRSPQHRPEPDVHPDEGGESLDEGDAIHIWGPVMVLPCRHLEIALTTLRNLLEDGSLGEVRVVVLDLAQSSITSTPRRDDFETLLETLARWGVEILLSGAEAQPLQARSTLERPLLIGRPRLQESIAMAFQVAEAGLHAA